MYEIWWNCGDEVWDDGAEVESYDSIEEIESGIERVFSEEEKQMIEDGEAVQDETEEIYFVCRKGCGW